MSPQAIHPTEQADAIARDGAAAHHDELVGLARIVAPTSPVLAAVLADPGAPDIARQRAFGLASRFTPTEPLQRIA